MYSDGSNLVYRSSIDGVNWLTRHSSSPATITHTTYRWLIVDTYVYYVIATGRHHDVLQERRLRLGWGNIVVDGEIHPGLHLGELGDDCLWTRMATLTSGSVATASHT